MSAYLLLFPKPQRYTIGQKLDSLALEIFELVIRAGYLPKNLKSPFIERAIALLALLKILARLSYETKALDLKKYLRLQESLQEIGRMLGGWKKSL